MSNRGNGSFRLSVDLTECPGFDAEAGLEALMAVTDPDDRERVACFETSKHVTYHGVFPEGLESRFAHLATVEAALAHVAMPVP